MGGSDPCAVFILLGLRPSRGAVHPGGSIAVQGPAVRTTTRVGCSPLPDPPVERADSRAASLTGTASIAAPAAAGSLLALSQPGHVLQRVGAAPAGLAAQHRPDRLRFLRSGCRGSA